MQAKLAATGKAVRDTLKAHAAARRGGEVERLQVALGRIRTRLAASFRRAERRGSCPMPPGVDAVAASVDAFVDGLLLDLEGPAGIQGAWVMTGGIVGGSCADGAPEFALTLDVEVAGDVLRADGGPFPLYGSRTASGGFELLGYHGALGCATGGYDVDLTIRGTRLAGGAFLVRQFYGHFPIVGTCPPCGVTWEGTMTRPHAQAAGSPAPMRSTKLPK